MKSMSRKTIFVSLTLVLLTLSCTSSYTNVQNNSSHEDVKSIDRLLLFAYQDLALLENQWLEIENKLSAQLQTATNKREKQKILTTFQEQQEYIEQEIEEVEALIEQLNKEKEFILNPPPPLPKEIEPKDNEPLLEPTNNKKISDKISLREKMKTQQLLYQPKRNQSSGSIKESSQAKVSSTPNNIKHSMRIDARFRNSRVERKTTSNQKQFNKPMPKNRKSSRENRPQKQNTPPPSLQNSSHIVFHRSPNTF